MSDTAVKERFIYFVVIVAVAFSAFAYANEITSLPASGGKVILNWDDNAESDLAGYNVYRSTLQTGPFSIIAANVAASYYEDNDVADGMVYFYYVTAVDTSDNESTNSEPAYASLRIPGDLDGSGSVNLVDLALFTRNWLDTDCWYCNGADLSGDEQVLLEDLQILTGNWLSE